LLGDHDDSTGDGEKDQAATYDELFRSILERVTSGWPPEANYGSGRGGGSHIFDFLMPKPKLPRTKFLIALRKLFDKAGVLRPDYCTPYAWKRVQYGQKISTYIPNWRDRRAPAKEILFGDSPFLYKAEMKQHRLRWTPRNVAHVYVDVSGSMNAELPWLAGALDPLHRQGLIRLYAFSTVVDEVRRGTLLSGKIKYTSGTDINCVYNYVLSLSPQIMPRKVVLLTDGYTGIPRGELHSQLIQKRIDLYVGIIEGSPNVLSAVAKHLEVMPKLR
jgi:hypothetical protein